MKVLSFLELSQRKLLNRHEYEHKLRTMLGISNDMSLAKFYGQPFKPEMITEYFADWVKEKSYSSTKVHDNITYTKVNGTNKSYRNPTIKYCFDKRLQIYGYIQYLLPLESDDGFVNRCLFPNNLDKFIIGCQDAGIELDWKVQP